LTGAAGLAADIEKVAQEIAAVEQDIDYTVKQIDFAMSAVKDLQHTTTEEIWRQEVQRLSGKRKEQLRDKGKQLRDKKALLLGILKASPPALPGAYFSRKYGSVL
jgi:uncharacterized protein YoxC